jgi:2-polyprenyl-6-methoxyphenol hydroxylase-like FAD-dependent oxidoreductase
LANGERLKADLIIGADGVRSAVRESVNLTERVTDLGDGCGRYLIDRRQDDIVGKSLEYWKGGRRVGVVPASPDKVYIYICCPAGDREGRISPADKTTWIESFPALKPYLERLTDNGRWAGFSDVTCKAWSKGKVAILGDAAHAMSPNLGQGAGVAMQSGLALANVLANEREIPKALRLWESRQRPIVDATQRYSRFYGRMGTRWPSALLDLRSAVVWGIGKSATLQRRINVAAHSDVVSADVSSIRSE